MFQYSKNNKFLLSKSILYSLLNFSFRKILKLFRHRTDLCNYSFSPPELTRSIKDEILSFKHKPLVSIILPTYNVDKTLLYLAIQSIIEQWYENWELCIADDASSNNNTLEYLKSISSNPKIKIKFLKQNVGIAGASNEALTMATGEFIALLDHDDELTTDALYEVVKAINITDADFIYSDEDAIINNTFCKPHFKPDYTPDMLLSYNYICHFTIIKKTLIDIVHGFSNGVDGAQDYDLFLKVLEHTNKIFHIQKVLYHWRRLPNSMSNSNATKLIPHKSGEVALSRAISRRQIEADIEDGNKYPFMYRVRYKINESPLVSILIPFKDKPELLEKCISSILAKSSYNNFEIIGISNNSTDPKTFELMGNLAKRDPRVKFAEVNIPFNYSKLNNLAVNSYAQGEHILLLNNDTEVISEEWIESLLEHSQKPEIGAVGGLLLYPNNKIQHAGIIIGAGYGDYSTHSHRGKPYSKWGYHGRPHHIQDISAVTGACLMVKSTLYREIGGLDEENFPISYSDIDLCLRLREKGYNNIYTPYCKLYHFESLTLEKKKTREREIQQRQSEVEYFRQKYKSIIEEGDPYYNPNLSKDDFGFNLKSL